MTQEVVIKRIKAIEATKARLQRIKEREAFYVPNRNAVKDAVIAMLTSSDEADRKLALRVAGGNDIPIPADTVRELLDSDETSGVASSYIVAAKVTELIPKLNEMLSNSKNALVRMRALEAVLAIGDESSKTALAEAYEQLIKGNPTRRAEYQAIQAKWNASNLPQTIHPLPAKTVGVYLTEGAKGTAFPVSNTLAPICDCCQKSMLCLLNIPKEADPMEMPVFHCPRCNFDSPIYLDLSFSPPNWIGDCGGETVDPDDFEDVGGGTIGWGLEIQGAGESRTFIGGEPDWVQGEVGVEKEFQCPECEQKMEFVIQMETDYTLGTGLYFFHGGIMYVHRCRECQVACYFFQTS